METIGDASDALSATFSALADPTRRAILARLSRGQSTVTELAEPFLGTMSLPAITKHVQVLERAHLVTKSKAAQFRHCQLNGSALREAVTWLETYRASWEEQLDRLDAYLKQTNPRPPETRGSATHARKK